MEKILVKTKEFIEKNNDKIKKITDNIKIIICVILLWWLANIVAFIVNTYILIVEEFEFRNFILLIQNLYEVNLSWTFVKQMIINMFDERVYNILKFVFVLLFYIIYYLKSAKKSITETFYKYRYQICLVTFIICVVFSVNGSAIGAYSNLTEDKNDSGLIWGVNRIIRTDEFMVNTPMAISQTMTGFKWNNDAFRGTDSNMFIVYGQPVKDISMIFRLTQIGYLMFGADRGLSFFWCIRLIGLFIVTLEFGMFILNKNKRLSFILAILMTFSPVIQWWFAINGLVEMIIAAELGIMLFEKFLIEEKTFNKMLYLSIIWICLGTYILTFYPAWMVPIAYIFLPIIIWVILKNKNNIKFNRKHIIIAILISLIFVGLLARIFVKSQDTIETVLNTVYPGNRVSTGGEVNLKEYLRQNFNVFMTTTQDVSNQCETVMFFDFIYLTVFLIGYMYIGKRYFKDSLINLLMIFEVFLNIYIFIGFPEIIAKITLMSFATVARTLHVIGIINLFLLFRILSNEELNEKLKFSNIVSVIISFVLTAIILILLHICYGEFFYASRLFVVGIINFTIFILILKRKYRGLGIACLILVFFSCAFINPLRFGTNNVTKIPLFEKIVQIDSEDSGIWIVDNTSQTIPQNTLAMYGLKTMNSTNVYPDVEKWKKVDIDNKYEEIYNRYAHVIISIEPDAKEGEFELLSNDSMKVVLNEKNLKDLNVKYIMIGDKKIISQFDDIKAEEKYGNENFMIYKLSY